MVKVCFTKLLILGSRGKGWDVMGLRDILDSSFYKNRIL